MQLDRVSNVPTPQARSGTCGSVGPQAEFKQLAHPHEERKALKHALVFVFPKVLANAFLDLPRIGHSVEPREGIAPGIEEAPTLEKMEP